MIGFCKPLYISLIWICIVYKSAVVVGGGRRSQVPPAMVSLWYSTYHKTIHWSQPCCKNIPVDYYKVDVDCIKDGIIKQNTTTTRKLTLKGLPSDQCCYGYVTAVNRAGTGPRSKRADINPPSPKKYYKIAQYSSKFDTKNITLTWTTKPYPTPGTIYMFHVEISSGGRPWVPRHKASKHLLCRGPDCLYPCGIKVGPTSDTFDQNQAYFSVTLPTKPASQYNVNIRSFVVGGSIGRMQGVYNFMTSPDVPSSPVRQMKVLAKNESSITASWLPPTESNGRLRKYNVSLTYRKQNCSGSISSGDYYIPVTTYQTVETRKDNTYTLTGLKPYTEYNLTVNAINGAGHGLNWSDTLIIETDPLKVVKGHLRELKTDVNTRSFEMAWNPACPIEGPVSTYSIQVFNRGQIVSTFETNNTFINIPDLQPDTYYTAHIRGKNTQIQSSVGALTKVEINVCMNRWNTLRDYFLGKLDESRVTIAGQAAILRQKLNETMEDRQSNSTLTQGADLDQSEKQLASLLEMDKNYVEVLLEPETDVDNKIFFEKLLPSLGTLDSVNTMQFRWEVKILLLKYLECQKTPDTKPWI